MKKLSKLLGAIALVASAAATAQTLSPTADSYVEGGTWANSNFGTSTGLFAQTSNNAASSYDSYLKFDTTSIGGPGSVASAKFRVLASLASGSVGMNAYAISDTTWSETGITWNNKPARGTVLGSVTVSGNSYVYYEFDVSSYIISEKAAGRNVVSFALHNPSNSSQAIWMTSRESSGNSPQLVIVANAAPTVSIAAPAPNTVFLPGMDIAATADAADSDGTVSKVEFFDGATLIGTATAAPYSATLTNPAAGTHTLTAKVTDNLGLATTSTAVTIRVDAAPTVSITAPANNSTFIAPASFTLSASAADSDGTVTKVDFYDGATLLGTATAAPYSFNVSNLGAGLHSLSAVATDNDGATASAAISVTVDAPPTISLTSPANNATFNAPANITITASAQDTDGSINRVELYANSTLIATLTAAPYSFDWANVAVGTYTLTAKAVDNNNAETLSAPVSITVRTVSTLYFIHVDHLDTPRLVADAAGTTVWRWDQSEPFGNNPADENPSGLGTFDLPLRLPGQYFDKEINLHYNLARDYAPDIGRYIQSDPIGLRGGINTYLYATDPLTQIDPEGLMGYRGGKSSSDYSSCGYYDGVAANVGCKYHGWAAGACRGQNAGVEFMSNICMITTAQMNCIRRCLVEEDQNARGRNECKVCTDRGACTRLSCINDYHKKCFAKCNVSTYCYGGRYWQGFPNDGDSPGQGQCCGK